MIYADEKLPTMNWRLDVKSKEYYDILVNSGFGWEFYPDLPNSWPEAEKELKEMEEGNV